MSIYLHVLLSPFNVICMCMYDCWAYITNQDLLWIILGKTDSPSFRSRELPTVLYLGEGPCENLAYILWHVVIMVWSLCRSCLSGPIVDTLWVHISCHVKKTLFPS